MIRMPKWVDMRRVLILKERTPMAMMNRNRAFTIVEILVVVSIIAMLAGFLMVALSGSQDAAKAAKANVKLKEIGMWMQLWSGDNNNRVLPSQFDYQQEAEAGTSVVYRTDENAPDDTPNDPSITREQFQGTWADILWAENTLHEKYGLRERSENDASQLRWESDSPDNDIFEVHDSFDHPFRSTFMNTRGDAKGLPGFFAANDFFDARSEFDIGVDSDHDGNISPVDRYFTYAMMNAPSRSIYLVDSIAGETISDEPEPWEAIADTGGGPISHDDVPTGDIDFRNGDQCLLLMLDGSIVRLSPWTERGPGTFGNTVDHSLLGLGYRVHQLTKRKPTQ